MNRLDQFLQENAPEAPSSPLGEELKIQRAIRRGHPLRTWGPVLALAAGILIAFLSVQRQPETENDAQALSTVWSDYAQMESNAFALDESYEGGEYLELAAYVSRDQ